MDEVIKTGYDHYSSIVIRLIAKIVPRGRPLINKLFYYIRNLCCTYMVLSLPHCGALVLLLESYYRLYLAACP